VQGFTALAQAGAGRADAAMYWRAYALDKMNLSADALSAVAELVKSFPDSRWLSDARALELQMRQRRGQPVAVDKGDDDLKLLAIQALQQYSPEKAVPLLSKVLAEGGSVRLKERALFVLAQSSSSEARAKLAEVARGSLNPDLQLKAVQFLGMSGQAADRQLLNELYTTTAALDLKRQVLRAFMMAGDRQRILAVATSEKTPELRTEAVRQLGMLGARDDLWQMYQKETVPGVKRDILQALGMSGATSRLIDVVNSERDLDLKVTAVRQLGMTGGRPAATALTSLYAKEQDPRLRRAAIDALFMQGNADALVSLARKETDPSLRRALVQKLSMMGSSPAALEYLTEILNK
jgi:HEAT repeat protein